MNNFKKYAKWVGLFWWPFLVLVTFAPLVGEEVNGEWFTLDHLIGSVTLGFIFNIPVFLMGWSHE